MAAVVITADWLRCLLRLLEGPFFVSFSSG